MSSNAVMIMTTVRDSSDAREMASHLIQNKFIVTSIGTEKQITSQRSYY
jgi:uncharacterized protein involved in tolerance to divalent cations